MKHEADIQAFKEMVATGKRTLQLLDGRIAELEVLLADEESPDFQNRAKEHPYFYGAIGSDDAPGILLNDSNQQNNQANTGIGLPRLFEGLVRIEEDAPFVWTHVLMTQTMREETPAIFPADFVPQPIFASVQNSSPRQTSGLLEVGFVENGSGRVLFQADRNNSVGEMLSAAFLDSLNEYEPSDNLAFTAAGTYRPGVFAQGHGPNAAFELPAETVLPASGVLTVQVKPSIYDLYSATGIASDVRVYITLLGYKVFGD